MQRRSYPGQSFQAGFGFLGTSAGQVAGGTISGAGQGAAIGGAIGSVVPIAGNVIGAALGAIVGGLMQAFGSSKAQEVQNFDQATAIYGQNPMGVLNIANKYLVLAGLFDLSPSLIKGNIPIYKKYGHMGEQRFVTDMMTLIYQAAQAGKITANDTPQSVYDRIVQPWIDGFGFGPMQDKNGDMIKLILIGMISEYVAGLQTRWYARGGDYPFKSLPVFALPAAATYSTSTSGTPTAASQATPVSPPLMAPSVTTALVPTTVSTPTSVAVPAGFSLVGMANGLQAYQGPDGAFYSWSGTVMSPLTGTLITASGQSATIQQGYPVQPSTQYASTQPGLYSNTQAGVSPYASSYTPTAAAAQAPAQTAGVSTSGLPAWLPWAAIGGTALLLFATARPLRGGNYKRARS
ncbi:MAG TPA: hypothetical protein VGQ73_02360 [Gemmatimonadales bacterium]|nr:hypothetical protein [Gemmatimonadales bacterium]